MPLLRAHKLLLTHLEVWTGFSIPCSVVGELIHYQSNTKELKDKKENTPLHLACMKGHFEVARMLLASHLLLEK